VGQNDSNPSVVIGKKTASNISVGSRFKKNAGGV
jgi:hypothetical protein